jgi:transcriptional regulator with GAF, ATPase, and Fis domain
MNSTATWKPEELETTAPLDVNSDASSSSGSMSNLKELVLRLLCEVQCITEVNALTIENGFDFYDEVSRFEIDLIKRALLQTGGHQVRAAKLLNLKVTTLNSKIKHYNLTLSGFGNVYPLVDPNKIEELVEPNKLEERQFA